MSEGYERTFLKQVRDGFDQFWKKKQLRFCEGANEPGCPPNTVRTNLPRKKGDFYWFGKTDGLSKKFKAPEDPELGESWTE